MGPRLSVPVDEQRGEWRRDLRVVKGHSEQGMWNCVKCALYVYRDLQATGQRGGNTALPFLMYGGRGRYASLPYFRAMPEGPPQWLVGGAVSEVGKKRQALAGPVDLRLYGLHHSQQGCLPYRI
jgi:hypothetical protein